jgi:hypothetical protein
MMNECQDIFSTIAMISLGFDFDSRIDLIEIVKPQILIKKRRGSLRGSYFYKYVAQEANTERAGFAKDGSSVR